MEMRVELGLKQQLKLTMELQAAIKLLALDRLELAERLRQELFENPILEEVSDTHGEEVPMTGLEPLQTLVQESPEDDDWKKLLDEYRDMGPLPSLGVRRSEDLPPFDANLTKSENLWEHLRWQLQMARLSQQERLIGSELIGNVNPSGYLEPDAVESIAESLGLPVEEVERVRQLLLQFDPLGVGATSLEECLAVQAEVFYPGNELVKRIIRNHLKELVGRNILTLAKKLGVSKDEIETARELIAALDPKPGRNFPDEQVLYVTPDVYVEKRAGQYVVMLNDEGLPRLRISSYYRKLLDRKVSAKTKDFIRKKVRSAVWFLRCFYQRQSTIRLVAESIVKFQKDFLDHGVAFLRPLVLRDVAEDIGMHESTVSRVTSKKWMHTPQGLFPMKFFFNPGIQCVSGKDLASEAVRNKIRDLVSQEDARNPLSDQQIVKLLEQEGLRIARRTVAKYRGQLNILPSSKRVKLS